MNVHTIDLQFQSVPQTIAAYLVVGPEGPVLVEDTECIADSFPGFERVLTTLGAELTEDE